MKRRDFIKNTGLASSLVWLPQFLRSSNFGKIYSSRTSKNLVVIQLSGGNDGLNTIIPYGDDIYYQSRPKIAIQKNQVLKLNDIQGLHSSMTEVQKIFKNGEMSIINDIGYPEPDRSHFRSMDIWHTASASNEYLSSGWLGRCIDNGFFESDKLYQTLSLDDSLPLPLKGNTYKGFSTNNIKSSKKTFKNPFVNNIIDHHHDDHHHHDNVAYLYQTLIQSNESIDYLYEKSKVYQTKIEYPNNQFANDLKQIAELMTADADIKVYYAILDGFDTHANQNNTQQRLLDTYDKAVGAFVKDLKSNNLFDDTLIMTFSEFGRRVKENAGRGTDHGTANNLYLMSGSLKKSGFYNSSPNLSDLDNGDLKFRVDFRNVYADIINDWIGGKSSLVLNDEFKSLNIF